MFFFLNSHGKGQLVTEILITFLPHIIFPRLLSSAGANKCSLLQQSDITKFLLPKYFFTTQNTVVNVQHQPSYHKHYRQNTQLSHFKIFTRTSIIIQQIVQHNMWTNKLTESQGINLTFLSLVCAHLSIITEIKDDYASSTRRSSA